jgi:hypothetical protein
MKAPLAATVVMPPYGAQDAIASLVRDLAVAAYALRARHRARCAPARRRWSRQACQGGAGELGVPLTAVSSADNPRSGRRGTSPR